jgi:hypothetical protein
VITSARSAPRERELKLAVTRIGSLALFGFLPAFVVLWFVVGYYHRDLVGIDLEQFLRAARSITDGDSPYPAFRYPPLPAFAMVPLSLLPAPNVVFTVILIACVPAALWLFGVRDWRCYGIVFLWTPVLSAVQTGNLTLLLLVGCAVCWYARDRASVVGVAGGLTVAAKVLCWPLVVWLAATRRVATALWVVAVAAVVTLLLWASLGFTGLTGYPGVLRDLGRQMWPDSYTVKVLMVDAGLRPGAAEAVGVGVALVVLAGCVVLGRRGDDRRSFALAITAMILASPIVWLHYFALLLAPVAVMRPRLSAAWFIPLLFAVGPGSGNGGPWATAGVLGVMALTLAVVLAPDRSRGWKARAA